MQGTTPTNRLRPIGDDMPFFGAEVESVPPQPAPPPPQQTAPSAQQHAATSMLLLALRALSQRSIIALGSLFILLTAASAFWLWLTIAPSPSVYQIIAVSIYGAFVLALDWMVLNRP